MGETKHSLRILVRHFARFFRKGGARARLTSASISQRKRDHHSLLVPPPTAGRNNASPLRVPWEDEPMALLDANRSFSVMRSLLRGEDRTGHRYFGRRHDERMIGDVCRVQLVDGVVVSAELEDGPKRGPRKLDRKGLLITRRSPLKARYQLRHSAWDRQPPLGSSSKY